MKRENLLREKFDPPDLDLDEDLEDEELLRQALADVAPIHPPDRTLPARRAKRPESAPLTSPALPFEEFLEKRARIESHHRPGYVEGGSSQWNRRLIRKLRRGGFSVQEDLDLHGFSKTEARSELEAFLRECSALGLSCVRVVHGKGRNSPGGESVLKQKFPEWLTTRRNSRYIVAFTSAPARLGGSGATLILLKSRKF